MSAIHFPVIEFRPLRDALDAEGDDDDGQNDQCEHEILGERYPPPRTETAQPPTQPLQPPPSALYALTRVPDSQSSPVTFRVVSSTRQGNNRSCDLDLGLGPFRRAFQAAFPNTLSQTVIYPACA